MADGRAMKGLEGKGLDRMQWRLLLMAIGIVVVWFDVGWLWDSMVLTARTGSVVSRSPAIGVIDSLQLLFYPVLWCITSAIGILVGVWLLRGNGRLVHRITWKLGQ